MYILCMHLRMCAYAANICFTSCLRGARFSAAGIGFTALTLTQIVINFTPPTLFYCCGSALLLALALPQLPWSGNRWSLPRRCSSSQRHPSPLSGALFAPWSTWFARDRLVSNRHLPLALLQMRRCALFADDALLNLRFGCVGGWVAPFVCCPLCGLCLPSLIQHLKNMSLRVCAIPEALAMACHESLLGDRPRGFTEAPLLDGRCA